MANKKKYRLPESPELRKRKTRPVALVRLNEEAGRSDVPRAVNAPCADRTNKQKPTLA